MKKQFGYRESPYAFMMPEQIKIQREREANGKKAKEHADFLNKKMGTDERSKESILQSDAFGEDCERGVKKKIIESLNEKK